MRAPLAVFLPFSRPGFIAPSPSQTATQSAARAWVRSLGAWLLSLALAIPAGVHAESIGQSPVTPEDHCYPPNDAEIAPAPQDPYAQLLAEQAISSDKTGLIAYLRTLQPTVRNRRNVSLLIARLGSTDFADRELAQRQLTALPVITPDDLLSAVASDQPEIGARAAEVLQARSLQNGAPSVAVACFKTITRQKIDGAGPAVLEVLPLYSEEYVLSAGREAVRTSATVSDLPVLRRIAKSGKLEARIAAIGGLCAVLAQDAPRELRPLLHDSEARIRLTAARSLADCGDRAALATLVDLLSSPDLRIRSASAATLRALTGRSTEDILWLDPAAQTAALGAWHTWLRTEGPTFSLRYPLKVAEAELGRTLVCLYARNEVIELDASGRQTFAASEEGGCPWACVGLPTGHRLVAMYSGNAIVEYGIDGKVISRIPVPGGPMSVQRLDSGATLVACNNAQKVVEVSDTGKILWEVSLAGGPCDATRLDNGNTLVTLQNANVVVEIDRAGKEVWKVENLHTPRTATRLDSGNTLICDLGTGKVMEFDANGREVWAQAGFASPFSAQRLPAGTTLISDTVSVKEIDRSGRVISENRIQPLGRVWRY